MVDRDEVRVIAREILAEQDDQEGDRVHRTARAVLVMFGIDPDDPEDLKNARKAIRHSMRWANATEQVRAVSLKTAVSTLVVGFMGLMLLAVQMLFNHPK